MTNTQLIVISIYLLTAVPLFMVSEWLKVQRRKTVPRERSDEDLMKALTPLVVAFRNLCLALQAKKDAEGKKSADDADPIRRR